MSWKRTFASHCTLLNLLSLELAIVAWFLPTGRWHINLGFYQFTTGYDAYKAFPILYVTWLAWRWGERNSNRPLPDSPLWPPLFALVLASLAAALGSTDFYRASSDALEIFCFILFYFILLDLPWRRMKTGWIAGAFALGHFYLFAVALRQYLSVEDSAMRVNAVFDHPNALGVYAVLGATLLGWLAARSQSIGSLMGVWAAVAALLVAGALSQSRSAYFALVVMGLVLAALGTNRQRLFCLAAALAVICGIALTAPSVESRFFELREPSRLHDDASRLSIWSALLTAEAEGLPFFGVGLSSVLPDRLGNALASGDSTDQPLAQWGPHNLYLALLLTTGLPGLLAYAWLIVAAFGLIARCPRPERAILSAGLIAFLAHTVFIFPLLTGNLPVAFFTLLFLATIRAQPVDEAKASQSP